MKLASQLTNIQTLTNNLQSKFEWVETEKERRAKRFVPRGFKLSKNGEGDATDTTDPTFIVVYREDDPLKMPLIYELPEFEINNSIAALQRTGIDKISARFRFEKFKTDLPHRKAMFDKAKAYAENPKGTFMLSGQYGTGKTHISISILHELVKKKKIISYISWPREVTALKFNMSDFNQFLENKVEQAQVIYLDDFLATRSEQKPTAVELQIAFSIIDHVYTTEKLLIISSNKTIAEIISYDEALGSRIFEMGKENKNIINVSPEVGRNYRMERQHEEV